MKPYLWFGLAVLLSFCVTTPVFANDTNLLVLGQFNGRFETVMLATYRSGTATPRIISIPPGAIFLDGQNILQKKPIALLLQSEGIAVVEGALGEYFNLPLRDYLIIDYAGAQAVVDAMGGVNFTLPYDVRIPASATEPAIVLKSGKQKFDGKTARRFLRYRSGDLFSPAELEIIKLQQLFMDTMIRQLANDKGKIIPVATKLPGMIKTNIGLLKIIDLGYEAVRLKPEDIKTEFGIIPGKFVKVNGEYRYQIQNSRGYRLP